MKRLILLILSFVSLRIAVSQSIIVNPDGTHSTIFHNGNTSTIVNPNGTHSPVFHNGNISTVVNPNGTHRLFVFSEPTFYFHLNYSKKSFSKNTGTHFWIAFLSVGKNNWHFNNSKSKWHDFNYFSQWKYFYSCQFQWYTINDLS